MAEVAEFIGDDASYAAWLAKNPRGFVVNTRASRPPDPRVLHRATCWTIRPGRPGAEKGAFTERDYIKVCSTDLNALRVALSPFSGSCSVCKAPSR